MKKILIFASILLHLPQFLKAQEKLALDTGMLGTWPQIDSYNLMLSPSGTIAAYVVINYSPGKNIMSVQSCLNRKEILKISGDMPVPLFFSNDEKHLCWMDRDSVFLTTTVAPTTKKFLGIRENVTYPTNNKGKWIVYRDIKSGLRIINFTSSQESFLGYFAKASWSPSGNYLLLSEKSVGLNSTFNSRLLDLSRSRTLEFKGSRDYFWSDNSDVFLIDSVDQKEMQIFEVSCKKMNIEKIWSGNSSLKLGKVIYTASSNRVAFLLNSQAPETNISSIWIYDSLKKSARNLLEGKWVEELGYEIADLLRFSTSGNWLMVKVKNIIKEISIKSNAVPVEIWSYKDATVYPAQNVSLNEYHMNDLIISANNDTKHLIDGDSLNLYGISFDDIALIYKNGKHLNINNSGPTTAYLFNLAHKSKYNIDLSDSNQIYAFMFSPTNRWLYFWDPKTSSYSSVNPLNGKVVNMTAKLRTDFSNETIQGVTPSPVGIAGWINGDNRILVYDNYDIWILDPAGVQGAINLTNGYGKRTGTKLRLVSETYSDLKRSEDLLLTGYNRNSGENGFFRMKLQHPSDPEILTMGPFTYYYTESQKEHGYTFSDGMAPIYGGIGRKRRWIVLRQSATHYPNLFSTLDFKTFHELSDLNPQTKYNWLTAERITWTMPNGRVNRGILYKPENFDSTLTYPVIFNYYEKLSHRVHQFPLPEVTSDNINIPWFVSKGYLVCTPDIQYDNAASISGQTVSELATSSVVSAAEFLCKRPYVDKRKLGIQGQSFGGYETNAIITRSNLFSAACEMAGTSNYISSYLTLFGTYGRESFHKQDHPQGRMGATPWERPDLYLKASPILQADKVVAPLLIVHNYKDEAINFRQGVEMFMALRRLKKPCWLLQYDNSSHSLTDKSEALDFTIRLTQFFDHYLKGYRAPRWMTNTNFAKYKGTSNFYDFDLAGKCGQGCVICSELIQKGNP